jgi:LDH2 family malate/lactate/ureidoglycolate dehydrogenase
VLYPGEIEHRTEEERRREGIEIEDATWKKLVGLATELGVPAALYAA